MDAGKVLQLIEYKFCYLTVQRNGTAPVDSDTERVEQNILHDQHRWPAFFSFKRPHRPTHLQTKHHQAFRLVVIEQFTGSAKMILWIIECSLV